jgi:hypothetical protein
MVVCPGHRYDITVIAVNTAGLGERFNYRASTGKFWGCMSKGQMSYYNHIASV